MAEDTPSPYEAPLDLPGEEQPLRQPTPAKKKGRSKLFLILLGIVLLIVVLVFGAMELFGKKPAPKTPVTNGQFSSNPTILAPNDIPSVSSTKTFTAESLAVTLTYPTNWTVSEKEGGITIKSPNFNIQTKNQGTLPGYFRLYIRQGARTVDSKYIGRAVVVSPTEKLTYTQPNPNQRKDTNLSFFGYDTSDNFAFMMITGNFTLKKGDTLGPNYGKEADTYIIAGGFTADSNKDDLSFYQLESNNFQSSSAYKQAVDIIKSLKVS